MEQLCRMQEPVRSRKAPSLKSANSSGVGRLAVRWLDDVEKMSEDNGL